MLWWRSFSIRKQRLICFLSTADISFEAGQVVKMLRFDQDVVAGMYPLKMILWDEAAVGAGSGG